ncbi:hypothetical protein NXS19_008939 [Fusarium pseudograminearum]|uniref:Pentatricopeptide repeat-containing protein-mitochondrial domain-containing protein n=1 Tax=Fusarium pseudograminearum (strain CS3096) TaxID=1028729 RepID=K3VF20_FUSPC|nr:hypothetical protein FPSE_07171 [Fusarium pseudograminearum CS3096]EKJ72534.1 hypothetical protein FPSE_07171 [Fusarium pseudograminearum CS3096]UZP41123.1 hypothetical protein NXS19_008939 [Fusarium pseudograminearum]
MPCLQLAQNGLRRCLWTASHKCVLPRAFNASIQGQAPNQGLQSTGLTQRRIFGTSNAEDSIPEDSAQALSSFHEKFEERRGYEEVKREKEPQPQTDLKANKNTAPKSPNPALDQMLPDLGHVSTQVLVDALMRLRASPSSEYAPFVKNKFQRTIHIVKYLLKYRQYPLNPLIYESMMSAMAYPDGSSQGVRRLLEDMREQSVPLTAEMCYLALEALTVHPEHLLRQKVVQLLDNYWFELTHSAKQNIALAMLREGQHELAMDKLDELLDGPNQVGLWIYDIFILELGRVGFEDEMLRLLKKRKHARGTDAPFRNIQLMALDMFSQVFHYVGTLYLWDEVVKTSIHNPSNGVLENILATAAKHGDTDLASQVLAKLSSRGKLSQHHHDAVIEGYANAEDIADAFSALNVLQKSGWLEDQGTTRPLYRALLKNRDLIDTAASTIETMQKEGLVPLDAVMVTVEAMAKTRTSEAAMPLFRNANLLSGRSPRFSNIGHLVKHSVKTETKYELAKMCYVELSKTKIPTTSTTESDQAVAPSEPVSEKIVSENETNVEPAAPKTWLERENAMAALNVIIPVCAEVGDFELAFKLIGYAKAAVPQYIQLRDGGRRPDSTLWRSSEWVEPFIKLALDAEDSRVWDIIDELDQGTDAPALMIHKELQRRRIKKRAGQRGSW